MASVGSSSALVHHILPQHLCPFPYPEADVALLGWSKGHSESPLTAPSFSKKVWDTPGLRAVSESLLGNASNDRSKTHLLANSSREFGAWSSALLISSCGLRMDDETIYLTTGLQKWVLLCASHISATTVGVRWIALGHMALAADGARASFLAMHLLMTTSSGHCIQLTCPHVWSPQDFIGLMADSQMSFPLFLGSLVNACCGMQPPRTLSHHLITVVEIIIKKCVDNLSEHNKICSAIA